jgi:Flp pilus assembly protein TadD
VLLLSLSIPVADVALPADATSLANRAVSWKELGNVKAAQLDLQRALELDSHSVPALFGLALLREQQGRQTEADALYAQVLDNNPAHAEAAGNLGRSWILQGRPAQAVPLLRRALEHRPSHAACWENLFAALYLARDAEGAIDVFHAAASRGVEIDPRMVNALEQVMAPKPNVGQSEPPDDTR